MSHQYATTFSLSLSLLEQLFDTLGALSDLFGKGFEGKRDVSNKWRKSLLKNVKGFWNAKPTTVVMSYLMCITRVIILSKYCKI